MDRVLEEKFVTAMYGLNTKVICGPKKNDVLAGRVPVMFPLLEESAGKGRSRKRQATSDDIEDEACVSLRAQIAPSFRLRRRRSCRLR